MTEGYLIDETGARIGVLNIDVFPYGLGWENRQGSVDMYGSNGEFDHSEAIEEGVSIQHTISWGDARQYPSEVALISSYPGDYFEIGQRVNGTWISAGIIREMSCMQEDLSDRQRGIYAIDWGKAFKQLPTCQVLISSRPDSILTA